MSSDERLIWLAIGLTSLALYLSLLQLDYLTRRVATLTLIATRTDE